MFSNNKSGCVDKVTVLLFLVSLQGVEIMTLHNFLTFITVSNVYILTIPASVCFAIHLHKFVR